jgi:endonuclease-3
MLTDAQVEEVFIRLHDAAPEANAVPDKIGATPFRSLISVVLSAQSRDEMTARATQKLFAAADTPQAILGLDEAVLKDCIRDAGLYNMKARSIRRLCAALLERHDGAVPADRKSLMALPGVGRKSTDILLRFVFGEPVVAVDTHVHRVCNRLGLARGKTEAQTAASLAPRVPEGYGYGAHVWLLEHGKKVCVARKPRCGACLLSDLCERNGVPGAGS